MPTGLATRCSACGTVFRVVPDQLRVSEGWVRCGRCSQVFNALESLVDLDTGLPRRDGAGGPASVFEVSAPGGMGESTLDIAEPAARPGGPPLPASAASLAPPPPPAAPTFASRTANDARELARSFESTAAPDSRGPFDSRVPQDSRLPDTAAPMGAAPAPSAALASAPAPFGAGSQAPSFIRQADRAARWRRPGVRLALAAVALLLSLTLTAQWAHTWRDHLATRLPASAPLLAASCAWLDCRIGPPQALNALSVESSGLLRVERSTLYRLQLTLRNRAEHAVALPALDLSLTDARGEPVARRVVALSELGATSDRVAAGAELSLQGALQALSRPDGSTPVIAGYTVELFYP